MSPSAAAIKPAESWLPGFIAERRDTQGRRCELQALVSSAELRYLACGEAGVWVVRIAPGRAPELIEQRATPGLASGFFVREGTLWVEATSVQAARLAPVEADATIAVDPLGAKAKATSGLPPAAAAPAPPPPAAAVAAVAAPRTGQLPAEEDEDYEPAEARVVAVEPGFAVIDMGTMHGVTAGDHVAFERVQQDRVDQDQFAKRRERIAIGTAVSIGESRTRVELGMGERVEVGTYGHPTREPATARTFTPPRLGGVWHAGFMIRPFLVVDNFGFGTSFEVRAGRRFDIPFHLEALVQPFAVATGRQGAVVAGAGTLMASFDSKLFEIGLGIGGQSENLPDFDVPAGTGTTLAQRLRIGSADGGNLELISYVVLFHQEFEFSSLHFHGQLPVGDRSWLIVSASGGSLGVGFGELGLKVMLTGNGDVGSFLLTASIGALNIFSKKFCDEEESNCAKVDYWGPMAGFGSEWRF